MNIKDISEKAHNHAVKKGFYGDDSESAISNKVNEESNELRDSISRRHYTDMEKFHKMFGESEDFKDAFEMFIKNSIGDEMADNIIMILAGAVELGIDIEKHIMYKQKYNGIREDH